MSRLLSYSLMCRPLTIAAEAQTRRHTLGPETRELQSHRTKSVVAASYRGTCHTAAIQRHHQSLINSQHAVEGEQCLHPRPPTSRRDLPSNVSEPAMRGTRYLGSQSCTTSVHGHGHDRPWDRGSTLRASKCSLPYTLSRGSFRISLLLDSETLLPSSSLSWV